MGAAVNSTYSIGYMIWPSDPFYIRYAEFGLVFWVMAAIALVVFGAKTLARGKAAAAA
ncbi:MAG: hypothetical protein ACT4OG_00875 [Alphaproteobacteria bacterium]